jgi:SAM-dependent methyltransferase
LPRTAGVSSALPFRSASFDLIFASWLLEHLATPAVDVAELGRVLRPGGRFIFITPNGRHPLSWVNHQLGRFTAVQGRLVSWLYGRAEADAFPTQYKANSLPQLATLTAGTGLTLSEYHLVGDPTYLAFVPGVWGLLTAVEKRLPPSRRIHLVGVLQKTVAEES